MTSQFTSLLQLLDFFKEEQTCKDYLVQQRWPNGVQCPHCGAAKPYTTDRGYKCSDKTCHKKFTVTVGTVFENSKIPLRIWFAAIYLCTAHKKGISSLQLHRDLNITQKTAWFVLHRVREMLKDKAPELLVEEVQADESYVGGKNKNRHNSKKVPHSQGRASIDKTPVVGLYQKDGKVITKVVTNTDAATLHAIMVENVAPEAVIVTDAYRSYNGLPATYKHVVVKGAEGQYVVNGFHTQNIENFWSLLKRGIIGIYHYTSAKHLSRYCDEFAYRYNTRKIKDIARFSNSLTQTEGRLKYNDLIGKVK